MPELHLTSIDLAQPEDEPTLWLMLTFAASMSEGAESAIRSAKRDAYLRSYVEGWGRDPDDLGLVARDGSGAPVGAAWVRRKPSGSPFDFGDESEPELSIGVLPNCRGQGVRRRLLRALLAECEGRFLSVVLSVRDENPAVALYAREGFSEIERIRNRVGGLSLVMRRLLARPIGE
jgi:ribosomal protein S18 acetylase RimI-like enzyme